MLSLRVALQRVAQDGVGETSDELCDQCGRMPASKRCPLGALCVVCAAAARSRAWRKRRACIAQLRKVGPVLLILGTLGGGYASAATRVHVHDGDTLTIDRQRWRLWGIDAPELAQRCDDSDGRASACGELARAKLVALVGQNVPRCVRLGRSFDRAVGRCYTGAVDLGDAMVRAGLALDFHRYSGGEYVAAEREARSLHRGIWAGRFVEPWVWRRTQHGGRGGDGRVTSRRRGAR